MKRAAVALLAASACHRAEPHDRAVQGILSLRVEAGPRGTTQDELVAALAPAGASLECSGDISQNEIGVYERGCMGTVPLAGCPTPLSATFVRNAYADGIPHLMHLRLDAPELGDCGPRGEPAAADPAWPHAAPVEDRPLPWVATLRAQLERELGKATAVDSGDLRWRTGRLEVVIHDVRRTPCRGLDPCRSYATVMADPSDRPARGASR